ncbi:MAG: hypothetical protein RL341_79 [Pseudomonadota bacterium]
MKQIFRAAALAAGLGATAFMAPSAAHAFCGFYVGKADASLFNEASQVIMARDGDRTVISMANDYKGELTEFALVVPVPTVLKREQINVGDPAIFARIDAYSAPRLAEYFDDDPCRPRIAMEMMMRAAPAAAPMARATSDAKVLGVKVEAEYTIGEYDIVILSAKESDGLETWLTSNGYKIPKGASKALGPYIKQDMKFFVAKVNLKEQTKTGFTKLRPLQFAFESEKFMLPLRLGMVNSNGPQDLIVFMLTRNGRVESSNYRTVKLPANLDLPVHVRSDFKSFYKAMFDQAAQRENHKVVFTEYFWDMSWCDPCAADPLSQEELRKAGVWWADEQGGFVPPPMRPMPMPAPSIMPAPMPTTPGRILPRPRPMPSGAQPVMLTRLHVRYTRDTFPEDLMFTQTNDRQNWQTRYVLRHPFKGEANCPEGARYFAEVARRQEREAQQLASLTGWSLAEIRRKMDIKQPARDGEGGNEWWRNLWPSSMRQP